MQWVILSLVILVGLFALGTSNKEDEKTIDEIIALAGDFKHSKVNPNGTNVENGRRNFDKKGVITEYDIILREENNANNVKEIPGDGRSPRNKRAAIQSLLWQSPSPPIIYIPYRLDHSFTMSSVNIIQEAIAEYNKYTCIRFKLREREDDYLQITNNASGCWSWVGRQGGAQELNLQQGKCLASKRIATHEFLHAVGCWHEQSRTDRDSYIKINYHNVEDNMEHNFDVREDEITYGIEYDYESIMHYGRSYFTSNGFDTVTTLNPAYQTKIGNAPTLSFSDIRLVSSMYNCAGSCPPANCPANGFQGFNCSCFCKSHDPNSPVVTCREVTVCTAPNVDCKCGLKTNACAGVANTVCDTKSSKCMCASGFTLVLGQCVNINICTTLHVGCYCQVQGANACAAILNSVCNSATGACECIATTVQSGSSCLTAFFSDGSAVSPFIPSAHAITRWVPTAGEDNYAFGVPSNSKYLTVSSPPHAGFKEAILETPWLGGGKWCVSAGVQMSNALIFIYFSTLSSGGLYSTTSTRLVSATQILGYYYNRTLTYNSTNPIKEKRIMLERG